MDSNNSNIDNIHLNILSYSVFIYLFELILLLLSMTIGFIIVFLATSSGLLHIHLTRFVQICGTFFVISALFRIAMIVGQVFGIEKLSKVQKIQKRVSRSLSILTNSDHYNFEICRLFQQFLPPWFISDIHFLNDEKRVMQIRVKIANKSKKKNF